MKNIYIYTGQAFITLEILIIQGVGLISFWISAVLIIAALCSAQVLVKMNSRH